MLKRNFTDSDQHNQQMVAPGFDILSGNNYNLELGDDTRFGKIPDEESQESEMDISLL